MKLAPLVPKPKPRDVGSHVVRRKPKAVALPALAEPETDEGESISDEASEGEVASALMLTDHRGSQRVDRSSASGFPRVPTHELLGSGIRTKLVVGDVDDPLEHEADAIADRVMRMPLPSSVEEPKIEPSTGPVSALRRACCSSCDCEDEEELRREPAAGQRGGAASGEFTARVHGRLGRGSPLSLYARSFLEPRLGVDLADVRTHVDADAGSLAQQVHARAFTLGRDIFFAPGELRPHSESGMRLLAHEVAHTLQDTWALRRTPQTPQSDPVADASAAVAAVDTGDDLLEQSEQVYEAVDAIRRKLQRVLNDLVMPNEEGVIGLDDYELPDNLRRKAKASVKRYRKITGYLESRSTLESVLMVQWLDAALEVIQLLRKCVNHIAEHDEFVGDVVEADFGDPLRRLSSRAKKLRKHPFFQQGAAIEEQLRPLEEAEHRAKQRAEIDRQLELVRSEMQAYWNWQSRTAIEAEHRRLTAKLFAMGGKSTTGVLEVQIEVLAELADPKNYESEGSITDRAQQLAGMAESDIHRGAAEIAAKLEGAARINGEGNEYLDTTELAVIIDAFRWLEFEKSETRVSRLAPLVLMKLNDPSGVLVMLDSTEQGKILLEWMAPPRRPELQFALLVVWADPDGASPRDPEDARAKLREQSRAARGYSVSTATSLLQRSGRLARYAQTAATRTLLIEMVYQLWLDGFSHSKVATGDLLSAALAPDIRSDTSIGIADGDLSIEWDGDDMIVSVDPTFNAKPPPVRVPASAGVWLYGADDPLMPACKLLELEARGDRNALLWAGQELAHGAGEVGTATNQWIEGTAKSALEGADYVLDSSMDLARDVVTDYAPEEYRDEALAVVDGLETAGDVVLTGVTYGVGVGVGVTKGAIDTGTGLVSLAGGAVAGVGELGSDAFEGDVLEDIGVKYRETEHTLLVTVDAVPEIAEGFYEQFQQMEGRDKVFLVGKAAGMVAFEVATTVATGGTSKLAKVEKLGDAADLAKAAENAGDLGDVAKAGRPLGKHGDAVDAGHRHYADADVLRKVEADLPPNTQVWVDDRLGPGDVIVEYDAPGGVIDASSVRIVTGRNASPAWIALHGATVAAVRKYSGLQGRIRKLIDELRLVLTKVDETAGSARWEAKLEVEKLPKLVDEELARLRGVPPGSREADEIHETLEGLAEQFEHWSRVVDGEITPGEARGFIAGKKKRKKGSADAGADRPSSADMDIPPDPVPDVREPRGKKAREAKRREVRREHGLREAEEEALPDGYVARGDQAPYSRTPPVREGVDESRQRSDKAHIDENGDLVAASRRIEGDGSRQLVDHVIGDVQALNTSPYISTSTSGRRARHFGGGDYFLINLAKLAQLIETGAVKNVKIWTTSEILDLLDIELRKARRIGDDARQKKIIKAQQNVKTNQEILISGVVPSECLDRLPARPSTHP